jgi:hypothetical protein
MNYSLYYSHYYAAVAAASCYFEIDNDMQIIQCQSISGFYIYQAGNNRLSDYCINIEYNNQLYVGYLRDADFNNFGSGIICKLTKRYLHEAKEQNNSSVRFNNVPHSSIVECRNIIMKFTFFIVFEKMSFICKIHDADTNELLVSTYISPDDLEYMSIEDAIPNNLDFELTDDDYEYLPVDLLECNDDISNMDECIGECVNEHM